MLKYSIIIPVKSINDYVRETVPYIQALRGPEWELFVIPNNIEENEWLEDDRISLLNSGRVGPADKRDLGAEKSSGDILVFLDDDSYPNLNILEIADSYFANPEIIALGGPGVTPKNDTFWQKVSSAVFLSQFTGGAPERYVSVGQAREMDDWPSVNLMVRRDIFLSVSGFDCKYWPGEDTRLCLKLKNTGKKLMYVPEMVVWHHRRSGMLLHLKQVGAYGLHRGFFARNYPETSLKIKYFAPTLFSVLVFASIIIELLPNDIYPYHSLLWLIYGFALLAGFLQILKYEKFFITFIVLFTKFYYSLIYHRFIISCTRI